VEIFNKDFWDMINLDGIIKEFWDAVNQDSDPDAGEQDDEVTDGHTDLTSQREDTLLNGASAASIPVSQTTRVFPRSSAIGNRLARTSRSDPQYHTLVLQWRRWQIWELQHANGEPKHIDFPR
jgi:hypothetical protein